MRRISIFLFCILFMSVPLFAQGFGGTEAQGSGSGLDADKLDGNDSTYFLQAASGTQVDTNVANIADLQSSTAPLTVILYNPATGELTFFTGVNISTQTKDAVTYSTSTTILNASFARAMFQYLLIGSTVTVGGEATFKDRVLFSNFWMHDGDTNTYGVFNDDDIKFVIGGLTGLNFAEGTTDIIYWGDGDWDYQIWGDTTSAMPEISTYNYANHLWQLRNVEVFYGIKMSTQEVTGRSNLNMVTSSQTMGTVLTSYGMGSSSVTIITTQGVFEKLRSTTVFYGGGHTRQSANGQIQYTGAPTKFFYFEANYCIDIAGGTNEIVEMRPYKNGSWVEPYRKFVNIGAASQMVEVKVSGVVSMATGDYLDVYVANQSGTNDFETHSGQISIIAGQ